MAVTHQNKISATADIARGEFLEATKTDFSGTESISKVVGTARAKLAAEANVVSSRNVSGIVREL